KTSLAMLTTIRKRRLGPGRIAARGFDFDNVHPQVTQKLAAERSHRRSQIEDTETRQELCCASFVVHEQAFASSSRGWRIEDRESLYSILHLRSSTVVSHGD